MNRNDIKDLVSTLKNASEGKVLSVLGKIVKEKHPFPIEIFHHIAVYFNTSAIEEICRVATEHCASRDTELVRDIIVLLSFAFRLSCTIVPSGSDVFTGKLDELESSRFSYAISNIKMDIARKIFNYYEGKSCRTSYVSDVSIQFNKYGFSIMYARVFQSMGKCHQAVPTYGRTYEYDNRHQIYMDWKADT